MRNINICMNIFWEINFWQVISVIFAILFNFTELFLDTLTKYTKNTKHFLEKNKTEKAFSLKAAQKTFLVTEIVQILPRED